MCPPHPSPLPSGRGDPVTRDSSGAKFCVAVLLALLSGAAALAGEAKKLDLNQATREQLIGLGLSESQAAQVVSHREKTGPFLQIDELLVVPQMRPDTVQAIRDRVTVDE